MVLVHGGYDPFMEEFYLSVRDFVSQGYTVILFEGPGQGEALKRGLKFTHEWEKPTGAVPGYLNLNDVAMVGISWGGFLALRAAAFELRISHAVTYDVLYDGISPLINRLPPLLGTLVLIILICGMRKRLNAMLDGARKRSVLVDWALTDGMYITGTESPL